MFSFLSGIAPKVYLGLVAVGIVFVLGGYIKYLKNSLEDREAELSSKNEIIKNKDEDIKNIIDGYEKTLAIEKEIASQKAITQEQKETVVTKYKTLIKEVEKRGEIKQDEKSNFTIVTF